MSTNGWEGKGTGYKGKEGNHRLQSAPVTMALREPGFVQELIVIFEGMMHWREGGREVSDGCRGLS